MTLKTTLYEHQQTAVNKLLPIRIGALYMEMGTGKSCATLEMITRRYNAGRITKAIWLCPCSVKATIAREIVKHIEGDLSAIEVHGIESLSSSIKLFEYLFAMVKSHKVMLVVDESILVKNHKAKRTQNIKRLAEYCPYRLILNGTPVSRTEADLFAQWQILDWRVLGYKSFWSFAANHIEWDEKYRGRIRHCLNIDYLTDKIAPYTYQVRKEDCLTLPPKVERTGYFNLTSEQARHYNDVVEFYLPPSEDESERWRSSAPIYRLFTACQQAASGRRLNLESYDKPITSEPFFPDMLDNPRMESLMNTVSRIEGKVLIWCKYTHEIEDVSKVLADEYGANSVTRLYGKMDIKARNRSLDLFENTARFLVGNKSCGGYGLNLQFCSDVVYYNNDFNWSGRAQSEDRVHRIGQDKTVVITSLCGVSTIDEMVLANLARKTQLVESFMSEIDGVKDKRTYLKDMLKGVVDRGCKEKTVS